MNPHDKKKETYEGVLLEELLHKAGVPQGETASRSFDGPLTFLAEAEDGYRVVFSSLAELDSGILESEVNRRRYRRRPFAVRPTGGRSDWWRPTRNDLHAWVRMLKSITVMARPRCNRNRLPPALQNPHNRWILVLVLERTGAYSYLKQAMGSRLAARFAG